MIKYILILHVIPKFCSSIPVMSQTHPVPHKYLLPLKLTDMEKTSTIKLFIEHLNQRSRSFHVHKLNIAAPYSGLISLRYGTYLRIIRPWVLTPVGLLLKYWGIPCPKIYLCTRYLFTTGVSAEYMFIKVIILRLLTASPYNVRYGIWCKSNALISV